MACGKVLNRLLSRLHYAYLNENDYWLQYSYPRIDVHVGDEKYDIFVKIKGNDLNQ